MTDKPNGKETAATGLQELSARQKKFLEKHHAEYLQAQADLNSGVAQLQLMQQKVRGQIATLRDLPSAMPTCQLRPCAISQPTWLWVPTPHTSPLR